MAAPLPALSWNAEKTREFFFLMLLQFKMHVIENFYIATLSIPVLAHNHHHCIGDDVVQLLLEEL